MDEFQVPLSVRKWWDRGANGWRYQLWDATDTYILAESYREGVLDELARIYNGTS